MENVSKLKLVFRTQDIENYGDEDRPYWKYKIGSTINVLIQNDVEFDADTIPPILFDLVEDGMVAFEEVFANPMFISESCGSSVEPLNRPSWFEDAQSEEGDRISWEPVYVLSRDLSSGIRTMRKASDSECSWYRAQLDLKPCRYDVAEIA